MAAAFPPASWDLLEGAPYVVIPTHGVYLAATSFTVDPNICIFETMTIGDACRASILEPLHLVLKRRSYFTETLETTRVDPMALSVIKTLTFYEPGDTIYNRVLVGGIDVPPRIYFPNGRVADLPDLALGEGEVSTQAEILDDIMDRFPKLRETGVVILFASCATWGPETTDADKETIMEHQDLQRRKFMRYTPVAPGGGIGVSRILDLSANVQVNLPENLEEYRVSGSNVNAWLERMMNRDAVASGAVASGAVASEEVGAGSKRKRSNSQGGGGKRSGRKRSGRKRSGRKTRRQRRQ